MLAKVRQDLRVLSTAKLDTERVVTDCVTVSVNPDIALAACLIAVTKWGFSLLNAASITCGQMSLQAAGGYRR